MKGRICLPQEASELRFKVIVASPTGCLGHYGQDATKSVVNETFVWDNMEKEVDILVCGCLHFLLSRTGEFIPRSLESALHRTYFNEVVRLDDLYMSNGCTEEQYILQICDELSSYEWL